MGEPIDTVLYGYNDGSWGDLLTSYDGQTITYDNIGNPLFDGIWNYTWEQGRQLASMSNGTTTWDYTYDANGMRTSRSNGTATYRYVYNGGQLSQMTVGGNTLTFTYDANGTPAAVTYNGTVYYYITTLQGDVLMILNADGDIVVDYTYDAWGRLISSSGTMASTLGTINPLRYRGYVYDNETDLYYLQSRYYDPEVGRFINADALVSTGQGILGNNMFAYCGNNPIIYSDDNGNAPFYALKTNCYADPYGGGLGTYIVVGGLGVGIGFVVGKLLTDALEYLEKQIQEKMALSLSKAKKTTYKTDNEVHHIAAKEAKNATKAATILNEVLPGGVEDAQNKILISTDVHRRIHTIPYYTLVNELIILAYESANGDKQKETANVIATLGALRVFIESLDEMSNINSGG